MAHERAYKGNRRGHDGPRHTTPVERARETQRRPMTRILMHEGKIRLGAHHLPLWQDGGY